MCFSFELDHYVIFFSQFSVELDRLLNVSDHGYTLKHICLRCEAKDPKSSWDETKKQVSELVELKMSSIKKVTVLLAKNLGPILESDFLSVASKVHASKTWRIKKEHWWGCEVFDRQEGWSFEEVMFVKLRAYPIIDKNLWSLFEKILWGLIAHTYQISSSIMTLSGWINDMMSPWSVKDVPL